MPAALLLLLAQADWRRVDLEGIALALPAAPRRVYPEGAPPSVRNWVTTSRDGNVGISLQPFDEAKTADVSLADDLDGFMNIYKGRIVAQADVVLNGWPGLDATLSSPRLGDIRFVAYRTDRGLVTVTAGGTGPGSAAFGKRVTESLALGDAFGKGPQKTAGPEWTRAALEPSPVSAEFPRVLTGGLPMSSPTSPFQARMGSTRFGNRRYLTSLIFPLKAPEKEATPEERWRSIQSIASSSAKGAQAKIVSTKESTLAGERSLRTEAESPDGTSALLIETTTKGNFTILATAIVPKALKDSPEVARFFRSFRADGKE